MTTNNAVGGGGQAKATLKPGMELKFAAFVWGGLYLRDVRVRALLRAAR